MLTKNVKNLTRCIAFSIAFPFLYLPNPAYSESINTATIMASSVSPSCADYKMVGMCYWLKCSWRGCRVRTSVKVSHFLPEMVISTYNHHLQSPWTEVSFMNVGAMGGHYQTPSKRYTQFTFKNGEAIGHPGGLALTAISKLGFACDSQTTPFQPYFLSSLDFLAWRFDMPEMFYPEALTPTMREVRANGDLWGNIYPRSGSVTQTHDYKAAAVTAQRIADIISRKGQLHVYLSAARSGGQGKWYPKEVKERDDRTHKWQMLSPRLESSCAIFPDGNALSGYGDKLSKMENYSWALWRPYSCCKRQGQKYLGHTDWMSSHTQ